MVFTRINTKEKTEQSWFMFSTALARKVFSDYVSLKLLFKLEMLAFSTSNMVSMLEVVEKSLKLYIALKEKPEKAIFHYSKEYGHNLEKLRLRAAEFDSRFDESDIKEFTKSFCDKSGHLYQDFRYGSHLCIEGFKTRLSPLMLIVEKIFFYCVFYLEEQEKNLVNAHSLLLCLIVDNKFHQANNRELLLQAVMSENPYFRDYAEYSWKLENERRKFLESIRLLEESRADSDDCSTPN